jgi:hypothetical protein
MAVQAREVLQALADQEVEGMRMAEFRQLLILLVVFQFYFKKKL